MNNETPNDSFNIVDAPFLYKALADNGICSELYAPDFVRKHEKYGNIIYPRRKWERRRYTMKQVVAIIKAFRPGGSRKVDLTKIQ